jgi:hypothetical protein
MAETAQLRQGLAESTVTDTPKGQSAARGRPVLLAMFALFQLHEYVVLAKQHISYSRWGFASINALVLAKVMLVADDVGLGTGSSFRAPIYGILMEVVSLAQAGKIKMLVEHFTLERASEAYHLLHDGKIRGRAVITPNN